MTESSLRDALEPLIARSEATGARIDVQLALFHELLAHPESAAEPVGVSDGVVEAATIGWYEATPGVSWADAGKYERAAMLARTKLILEAAAPLMGATPVASRERVSKVQKEHRYIECNDNSEPACLCGVEFPGGFDYIEHSQHVADALLAAGVFHEAPTREQVEAAIDWRYVSNRAVRARIADAVLALMGGADEQTCAAEHPRGFGRCVFVAGHHYEAGEDWTPHADSRGRSWNSQPPETTE